MKNRQKHQNYKIYKIKSYKPQETYQNKWDLILNSKLKVIKKEKILPQIEKITKQMPKWRNLSKKWHRSWP